MDALPARRHSRRALLWTALAILAVAAGAAGAAGFGSFFPER